MLIKKVKRLPQLRMKDVLTERLHNIARTKLNVRKPRLVKMHVSRMKKREKSRDSEICRSELMTVPLPWMQSKLRRLSRKLNWQYVPQKLQRRPFTMPN